MNLEYLQYDSDYLFNYRVTDKVNQIIDNLSTTNKGFMDYNDNSTQTTPVALISDVWTAIPNDGQGAFTNKTFKPNSVTELLDESTGFLDCSELPLGSAIIVRNDYTVIPNTNNSLLRFRYTLGSGLGEYTLEKTVGRLDAGSGVPYRFSLTTDYIYMGDENTRNNPIKLEVKLGTTGSLINAGSVIQVV